MTFSLKCKSETLSVIDQDAKVDECSCTVYINKLLYQVTELPQYLTDGTRLEELQAYDRLFRDEVMSLISEMAKEERRTPDQMILWLLEFGLGQLKASTSEKKKNNFE